MVKRTAYKLYWFPYPDHAPDGHYSAYYYRLILPKIIVFDITILLGAYLFKLSAIISYTFLTMVCDVLLHYNHPIDSS